MIDNPFIRLDDHEEIIGYLTYFGFHGDLFRMFEDELLDCGGMPSVVIVKYKAHFKDIQSASAPYKDLGNILELAQQINAGIVGNQAL